jgi:hypothetical protein
MAIEAEHKRATGEQRNGESSKDAVRLLDYNPQEQHNGQGQEQVRLHGAEQQSCTGKEGPRLVEVKKKYYAEKQKDAKLPGHQALHEGREAVTEQV